MILIALSSSTFLVQADIVNNLKAEIEEPNLSQPNISSTDEQNYSRCKKKFFHILEQIDDRLMIGISLGGEIYSPLKVQPIISLSLEPLIGMPLFSNSCWVIPLLDEETERQIQEEEYFLLMNNFFE
jgi:hypothetical protein